MLSMSNAANGFEGLGLQGEDKILVRLSGQSDLSEEEKALFEAIRSQYADDPLALEQIDAYDPTSFFTLLMTQKTIAGLQFIRSELGSGEVDAIDLASDQQIAEQYPNLTAWLNSHG